MCMDFVVQMQYKEITYWRIMIKKHTYTNECCLSDNFPFKKESVYDIYCMKMTIINHVLFYTLFTWESLNKIVPICL